MSGCDVSGSDWTAMVSEWRKEQARADGLQAQLHATLGALKAAQEEIDGLRDDFNLPRDSFALDLIHAAITAATHPAQAPVEEE